MILTLRDLLKTNGNHQVKVLGGERGLDKEVTTIFSYTCPGKIKSYNSGGLILLRDITPDEIPLLKELIPKMAVEGIAGLVLTKNVSDLSPEIIDLANKYIFPVILVPNEGKLFDLRLFFEFIINKKQYWDSFYNLLKHFLLEGGNIQQLVEELAQYLKRDIAFLDDKYQKLYVNNKAQVFKEDICTTSLREVLSKYCFHEVKLGSHKYGYLIINQRDENEYLRMLLRNLEVFLILLLQKQLDLYDVQGKYMDLFIQDLLSGQYQSIEEIRKEKISTELEINTEIFVGVLEITEKSLKEVIQKDRSRGADFYRNQLLDNSKSILHDVYPQLLYTAFENKVVYIFYSKFIKNDQQRINEIFPVIINQMQNYGLEIVIGIGRRKKSLFKAPESYQEALIAIKLGKLLEKKQKIVFYNQLGVYNLLIKIQQNEYTDVLLNQYLNSLIKYDEEYNMDLFETLEHLVKNDWDINLTSQELFVHYNTVKYRMKKIQEILQLNLEDSEIKFNIALALKLYYLKNL